MIDVKNDWRSGLNLDDSYYNLPKNAYVQALNITRDAIVSGQDNAISNIVANRFVSFSYPVYVDGVIDFTTGQNPFDIGDNIGTITATAGATVLVQLSVSDVIGSANVAGTIDATAVDDITTTSSYAIQVPPSGVIDFNLVLTGHATVVMSLIVVEGYYKCIGAYPNVLRKTIIYFIYNSTNYDLILEFNTVTRAIVPIFTNLLDSDGVDVLGFTETGKITSINVYNREEGDLLFFIDSIGRPTYLDITLFKAGTYTPVTRDILDVCLRPPLSPITAVYGNDTTVMANNFYKKLLRFRSSWINYDDGKSCYSTISTVPLPANILDPVYTNIITNNNLINLVLNSGPKQVKEIELCVSISEATNVFGRFQRVALIKKENILLSSDESGVINGTTTTEIITFSGNIVSAGTIINIYLTLLPSTQTLVGTYTVMPGDNITSIVLGLSASITSIGIGTSPTFYSTTGLSFDFDNTLYSFDQVEIILPDTNVDNLNFNYAFYNDGTYPIIPDDESLLLYDYVPPKALAGEMPNGNVLAYGGITEGYDKIVESNVVITINTIAATSGGTIGTLSAIYTHLSGGTSGSGNTPEVFTIVFSGVPSAGTTVVVQLMTPNTGTGLPALNSTYVTAVGDTAVDVANGIKSGFTAAVLAGYIDIFYGFQSDGVYINGNYVGATLPGNAVRYSSFSITPASVSGSISSIATWKWSTSREIGRIYYSQQGRTNGVTYNSKISFPAYAENGSQQPLLPYINVKIYDVPPIWAHSYQIVFTKEPTRYLFFEAIDVLTDNLFLYFDITNLGLNQKKSPTTAAVISWSFVDGDRMRLIRRMSDGHVYGSTFDTGIEGIVASPTVNNVVQTDKTFVKIQKLAPFAAEDYSSNFFIIEFYRPGSQLPNAENAVYYECGVQYAILDPETASRRHAGQVTDQSTDLLTPAEMNLYNGDSYYRSRTVVINESSSVGIFNVQDRNFVDFYVSEVSSVDGRALVIEQNAREAFYGATIRHGEAFQANTNVNGLHRFYANSLIDCDYSYGNIIRLVGRDRILKVFQSDKTGRIPLFNQISKDQAGNIVQVITDKLLNPIEYYVGNWGIGTAATSVASYNFADYFVDNVRGAILRSSYDGIDVLSILYNVNSWATEELPLRTGDYFTYGAFDQKLNNYIIALEAVGSSPAQTLVFSEGSNEQKDPPSFDGFISAHPEMMCTLGTLLVSWLSAHLWTHDAENFYNSFYGVNYESSITPVFNDNILMTKTLQSIDEKANTIWDCPEIITDVYSYGTTPQQTNLVAAEFRALESRYVSSIKRDVNSRGAKINGSFMKGRYAKVKFRKESAASLVVLNIIQLYYTESNLNNR